MASLDMLSYHYRKLDEQKEQQEIEKQEKETQLRRKNQKETREDKEKEENEVEEDDDKRPLLYLVEEIMVSLSLDLSSYYSRKIEHCHWR